MKYFLTKSMLNTLILITLLASLLGSPLFVRPARAVGFIVTKTADTADGACNADCSLREAITAANAVAGADTISLPPGTYTLTRAGANENANASGDLDITSVITINGSGKPSKIIQAGTTAGSGIDRVFHIVSGTLALNNVTVRNGRAPAGANGTACGPVGHCPATANGGNGQHGGGILNAGTLTLNHVTISNNRAGRGGKAGNLVCTLLGPSCSSHGGNGGRGGGIYNTGTLTISASVLSGNQSGSEGLEGSEACAVVCNSFTGSVGAGGGLFNEGSAPVAITGSTFSGNSTGDGDCDSPYGCGSEGGGLYNQDGRTATITNSTFSGNHAARGGGGAFNGGALVINGSSFLGNTAFDGVAIENQSGQLTISNSTFSDNSGTSGEDIGLLNWFGGSTTTATNNTFKNTHIYNTNTLNLFNNILTHDGSATDCSNFETVTGSNNLVKATGSSACGLANGTNGNIVGTDPALGALVGSPAHYPLAGSSPAINAGSDAKCAAAPVSNKSQNGVTRPDGAHCDIGSFELDVTAPTVVSSVTASPNPTAAASVAFTVTFSEPVTGVDVTDFSLVNIGVFGAAVTSITGSGATRSVNVSTGSGSGTIRLTVVDDNTIVDAASNPLNGGLTLGGSYSIDRLSPEVLAIVLVGPSPTDAAVVNFGVTFSEPVLGINTSDFSLTTSGVQGASITSIGCVGSGCGVTVNTGTGSGAIRLDVPAGAVITDLVGNPMVALPFTLGEAYTIDRGQTLSFNSQGANDGFVLESAENSSTGGTLNSTATTFNLGDDAANKQLRAILSFDTSSLPDNATVNSVLLRIKQSGAPVGSNPFSVLNTLVADISTGPFGGAAAVQLADFNAVASTNLVGTFDPTPIAGWYTNTLNATAFGQVNTTGLTQLRLRFTRDDNNNLGTDLMKFLSGDSASDQPQLIIGFTTP